MAKKTTESITYESASAELQQIVQDLQEEQISIDDLSEKTARATELIRFCRERLRMAEEEVGKITSA